MYIIVAPLQIKEGFRERFIKEILDDAKGSVNNEPGCLRFDVIQDSKEPNRIWLYEVYKDEAAFQEHTKAPHFIKWRDAVQDWLDERPFGALVGGTNIWPTDGEFGYGNP